MINQIEVVENMVVDIKTIAALGPHLMNDFSRVQAFHIAYPGVPTDQAIRDMPQPGILVRWVGSTRIERSHGMRWEHVYEINVRIREQKEPEASTLKGYPGLITELLEGIPTGSPVAFGIYSPHTDLLPASQYDVGLQTILLTAELSFEFFRIGFTHIEVK